MRRSVVRIALFLLVTVLEASSAARADRILNINPEPFYRFRVPSSRLGYFLTRDTNEGYYRGYILEGALNPYFGAPPAGLMPTFIGNYTLTVRRYRVDQRSTPYFYYTTGFASGAGYVYEGIAGYALPANGIHGGTPFHVWYSQDYGYWYTANPYENPPNGTYRYHGVPFNLFTQAGPQTVTAPDCNLTQKQDCTNLGGNWNDVSCTCEAPSDPCAPYYQNICTRDGGTWVPNGCYCQFPDPCEINPSLCGGGCDPRFEICPVQ